MVYEEIDHIKAKEIINFQISYNRKKIKSTWAIAILIISMFLLEEYFGGQHISVLIKMGANANIKVKEGEYFRLFTSVFLHAGFMHVFFNTYVLFALGGFFNRILGESKYLFIFLSSGLFGSLASIYLGKSSVSVGASGAIWGLFGASLALALFPNSLLPEAIRLRLRKVTFINLLINLGVSFLPMIDFWAHIGGGMAGFLFSLPIIFRPSYKFYNFINYLIKVMSLILVLVYGYSISYCFYKYKPWLNELNSPLEVYYMPELPFTMLVPKFMPIKADLHNNAMSSIYTIGDPMIHSILIDINFLHEKNLGVTLNQQWLKSESQRLLKQTTLALEIKKSIYIKDINGDVLYYQQPLLKENIIVHSYFFIRHMYLIKISIIAAKDIKQITVDEFARHLILGVIHID